MNAKLLISLNVVWLRIVSWRKVITLGGIIARNVILFRVLSCVDNQLLFYVLCWKTQVVQAQTYFGRWPITHPWIQWRGNHICLKFYSKTFSSCQLILDVSIIYLRRSWNNTNRNTNGKKGIDRHGQYCGRTFSCWVLR